MNRLLLAILCFSVKLASAQGSGFAFHTTATSIDLGNQVSNGVRTIECWFYPLAAISSSLGEPKSLIVRDFDYGANPITNEFGLSFFPASWGNGGKLVFFRAIGNVQHLVASNDNSWLANHWYHVAVTLGTDGMKMYINGVLQTNTESSTAPIQTMNSAPSDVASVGKWGSLNLRRFDGKIDEIRFWDHARSQNEIRADMCHTIPASSPGLRLYLELNEGSGSAISDSSPNAAQFLSSGNTSSAWSISGAPIGNTSNYLYSPSFSAATLSLGSVGNNIQVSNITSSAEGIHLYHVNSTPNSTVGLASGAQNEYYGVFLTDRNGNFDLTYDNSSQGCSTCDSVYSRIDNADAVWQLVIGSQQNCQFDLPDQNSLSSTYSYRGEYIIAPGQNTSFTLGNDTSFCTGGSLLLEPNMPLTSYTWSDGSHGTSLTVNQPGIYWLESSDPCFNLLRDTILISALSSPLVDLGPDRLFCADTTLTLSLPAGNNFLWSSGSTSNTIVVSNTATISGQASNICGVDRDTVNIQYDVIPEFTLGPDLVLCPSSGSITLDPTPDLTTYLWSTGSAQPQINVTGPGLYWVSTTNLCGDAVSDSILVEYESLPEVVDLGPDTLLCSQTSYTFVLVPGGNYVWSNGTSNPTYTQTQSGLTWVSNSNSCGTYSDTVQITFINAPAVDLGPDKYMCAGNQIKFEYIGSPTDICVWSDGSENRWLTLSDSGSVVLEVENECGRTSDTVKVILRDDCDCILYVPNSFTPDGDEYNNTFIAQSTCPLTDYHLLIWNRWGELIFESLDIAIGWDGTYHNKLVKEGVFVYEIRYKFDSGQASKIEGHVSLIR